MHSHSSSYSSVKSQGGLRRSSLSCSPLMSVSFELNSSQSPMPRTRPPRQRQSRARYPKQSQSSRLISYLQNPKASAGTQNRMSSRIHSWVSICYKRVNNPLILCPVRKPGTVKITSEIYLLFLVLLSVERKNPAMTNITTNTYARLESKNCVNCGVVPEVVDPPPACASVKLDDPVLW